MRRFPVLFLLASGLCLTQFSGAQTPTPPMNKTNFGMIGITRGQTLRLNVVAYPPDPCSAQLGFQDGNGNPVGASSTVALPPGESAFLDINGNTLASDVGQRVQLRPTVVPTLVVSSTAVPETNQCVASAEVIESLLGITTVLVPGFAAHAPVPQFGLVRLTEFETLRLNVVAVPPDACVGQISFEQYSFGISGGIQVGNSMNVGLAPGHAASLDILGNQQVTGLEQRVQVRPIVNAPNGGCTASAEIYLNAIGTTVVYWPPDPCGLSSRSAGCFRPSKK
jgi:hypothetical protein